MQAIEIVNLLGLLLVQVFVACDMANVHKQATQQELWEKIERVDYMMFAVQEAFYTLRFILESLLVNDEGSLWYACALIDFNHFFFFLFPFEMRF